jgi:hypothetical protein
MWIFNFYRLYISAIIGIGVYLLTKSVWLCIGAIIIVRFTWLAIELIFERLHAHRLFKQHAADFKQVFGPYGIRIANKAESEWRVMKSLVEVFESNQAKLKKNVEQLEVMDTLFNAGMRPEGYEYLLHDLKLKYGKRRLEAATQ